MAGNCFAARLMKVGGEVFVNEKRVTKPQKIKEGDRLKAVGKKSFFVVLYKDKSRFMIQNGELKVEELSAKEETSTFQLISGYMFSYVNPKNKKKKKFNVKTNNASFGVRGTKFFVSIEKDNSSYLCVCDGKVAVNKKQEKIIVGKGEDLTVKEGQKMSIAKANDQMWLMAKENFAKMGLTIKR